MRGNPCVCTAGTLPGGSIPACAGEPGIGLSTVEVSAVYPRVCGGTCTKSTVMTSSIGLSPRVRGNPFSPDAIAVFRRSIPACAGEPSQTAALNALDGVYPRVCGGTLRVRRLRLLIVGLSPRVRGNRHQQGTYVSAGGSIPACAGEPTMNNQCGRKFTVYPRVCGGTTDAVSDIITQAGLSPRVRGNPMREKIRSVNIRSIPACAGEPPTPCQVLFQATVYPRVCGGTRSTPFSRKICVGLSPRVRGNLGPRHRVGNRRGSIPACAGEPRAHRAARETNGVYPRVCGGTGSAPFAGLPIGGLSPRVRGNQTGQASDHRWAGSIPACAGEPSLRSRPPACYGVYPRVCGGTSTSCGRVGPVPGLSPRVRGNPIRITR